MSILVNEEKVPEELIEEEMKRLVAMPGFQSIPDEAERAAKAHKAAEMACIDRIVIHQISEFDDRPLDETAINEGIVQYQKQLGRPGGNDAGVPDARRTATSLAAYDA